MARVKSGVPTVKELKEGELEHRYVNGTGLVGYTRYENQLYSSKMYPSSVPPIIDKKARSVIRSSDTVNIITGELDLDLGSIVSGTLADGDDILFLDATASYEARRESLADLSTLLAGAGLAASSSVLAVGAGTLIDVGTNDISVDLNEAAAAVMAAGDGIIFVDADDSNVAKQETLQDLLDTVAGTVGTTGLDRSSATLVVSDLHPVGVDGSANQLLTDDGDGTVTSEADLLFASNVLYPTVTAHNAAGKALTVSAGDTTAGTTNNIAGGALTFEGGIGKGSGAGGDIIFKTANAGSSGSSLNSLATALTISDDLSATFPGVLNGSIGVNLATASGITTVGSSNALTISAAGVLTVNNTTAASSSTSGSVIIDGGVGVAGILWTGSDVVVGDDLIVVDDVSLSSDGSIFRMGDGGDFSITHDGGTGATVTSSGALVVDSTASTLTLDGHSGVTLQTGTVSADITLDSGDDIHLLPTGYVGINDTTPESLLHMKGANPVLTIQDTETGAASADARIRLAESDGSAAVENYWDIHNSGINLLLTRSDGSGNVVIRSSYITDHAVNSKPATNGRHFATGDADYQQNYSWIGLYDQLALATEHDADFGDWS